MNRLYELYSEGERKYVVAKSLTEAIKLFEKWDKGIVSSIKEIAAEKDVIGIFE